MTLGLALVVKVVAFWGGVAGLLRLIWVFCRNRKISPWAAGIAVVGLTAAALLPSIPGNPGDAYIRLPMAIPLMPMEYVLALMVGIAFASKAFRATTAVSRRERRSAALFALGLLIILCFVLNVGRQSTVPFEIRGGVVDVTLSQAAALSALALVGTAIVAATVRTARGVTTWQGILRMAGLLIGSVVFGMPLAWMLSTSFREDAEINSGTGVRWIPMIQNREPYRDPVRPYYSAVVNGVRVEGNVRAYFSGNQAEFDVLKPLTMIGRTLTIPADKLTEQPEMKPVVTLTEGSVTQKALDLETLDDGRHRVHPLASRPGQDVLVDAAKLTPVRSVGTYWKNFPDALAFLPADTNYGLLYVRNTLTILILSVIGSVFSCSIVAYAFARLRFPGRGFLFVLLLSTMMLPGAVTLMPQFMIFRGLGWVDTLRPLWVPAFFGSAFNIFMLRQFFAGVPVELEEAAKLDGCGVPRTFWSVSLPQIVPALATIAIWTAIGAWNNFTGPLIYINSPENMPVSYAVQLFQGQRNNDPGILMAFVTLSVIPVIALFLVAQRYFTQSAVSTGLGGR